MKTSVAQTQIVGLSVFKIIETSVESWLVFLKTELLEEKERQKEGQRDGKGDRKKERERKRESKDKQTCHFTI